MLLRIHAPVTMSSGRDFTAHTSLLFVMYRRIYCFILSAHAEHPIAI